MSSAPGLPEQAQRLGYRLGAVTYLDAILEWHRDRAKDDDRPLEALLERARAMPPTRPFEGALRQAAADATGVAVIAEIKLRSPSK